jgi:predicted HAD superfamily Cof-like phosphohydrolase
MDIAAMLAEFHETFYGEPFGSGGDLGLRRKLHDEEGRELLEALDLGDDAAIVHELADVVYIAYGTAHTRGYPLDAVIAAVHRANMAKVGPGGSLRFRADGKLLKPLGWKPADVAAVLREHGGPGDDAA